MKSIKEIIIIVVSGVVLVVVLFGLARAFGVDLTGQQTEPTPVESSSDIPIPKINDR